MLQFLLVLAYLFTIHYIVSEARLVSAGSIKTGDVEYTPNGSISVTLRSGICLREDRG